MINISSQETGVDIKLSHSQVGVWNECEQRWYYTYVDNIVPKKRHGGYELGILFHELTAVYDQLLVTGFPIGDPLTWERVSQYAQEEFFSDPEFMNNLQLYNIGIQATKRYVLEHSRNVDKFVRILGAEDEFNVDFRSPRGRTVRLNGFIDRFYEESSKKWLLDRKTSAQGKHFTDNEILMDPQLLLYAAVYREMGHNIFGVAIDSVSTYKYTSYSSQPIDKIMKRIRSYRTDVEKDYILNYYLELADSILDRVEAGGPFYKSLSRNCARCPYSEICLYSIKGIDPTFLVEANFEPRKDRVKRDETKLFPSEQAKEQTNGPR